MIYKKFYLNIIGRSILLIIVSIGFAFSILNTNYLFTITLISMILIAQVWELIYYCNKANRKITLFLDQYKSLETTPDRKVNTKGTKDFEYLLSTINSIIKDKSIQAESQYHYLQSVVDNTQNGIVSYDISDNKIEFINKTALQYFEIKSLSSLSFIKDKHPHLYQTIIDIPPGEQKMESLNSSNGMLQLSIKTSLMKFMDRTVKIISIHNIQLELEENELESWRKLVRVFTHEISNSIAPINSITNSLIKILDIDQEKEGIFLDRIKHIDSISGLKTIQNRSLALKAFIEKFRDLTRIPQLNAESFMIRGMLENTYLLFEQELCQTNILLKIQCQDDELTAFGDQHLLEQVMINLVKNAIQSCDKEHSEIILSSSKNKNGRFIIHVIDNGCGIEEEQLSQIFIPFFTSKEEGSGIGLSLCRQIMRLHGGSIRVLSKKEEGSTFTLEF